MRTPPTRTVRVLGDIRELQKVRERADHPVHVLGGQSVEEPMQCGAIIGAPVAREAHGRLSHRFYELKDRVAFLLA